MLCYKPNWVLSPRRGPPPYAMDFWGPPDGMSPARRLFYSPALPCTACRPAFWPAPLLPCPSLRHPWAAQPQRRADRAASIRLFLSGLDGWMAGQRRIGAMGRASLQDHREPLIFA